MNIWRFIRTPVVLKDINLKACANKFCVTTLKYGEENKLSNLNENTKNPVVLINEKESSKLKILILTERIWS